MGIPASGKPISVTATGIFRLVDGKLETHGSGARVRLAVTES